MQTGVKHHANRVRLFVNAFLGNLEHQANLAGLLADPLKLAGMRPAVHYANTDGNMRAFRGQCERAAVL